MGWGVGLLGVTTCFRPFYQLCLAIVFLIRKKTINIDEIREGQKKVFEQTTKATFLYAAEAFEWGVASLLIRDTNSQMNVQLTCIKGNV